jgi:hypothetical protein
MSVSIIVAVLVFVFASVIRYYYKGVIGDLALAAMSGAILMLTKIMVADVLVVTSPLAYYAIAVPAMILFIVWAASMLSAIATLLLSLETKVKSVYARMRKR